MQERREQALFPRTAPHLGSSSTRPGNHRGPCPIKGHSSEAASGEIRNNDRRAEPSDREPILCSQGPKPRGSTTRQHLDGGSCRQVMQREGAIRPQANSRLPHPSPWSDWTQGPIGPGCTPGEQERDPLGRGARRSIPAVETSPTVGTSRFPEVACHKGSFHREHPAGSSSVWREGGQRQASANHFTLPKEVRHKGEPLRGAASACYAPNGAGIKGASSEDTVPAGQTRRPQGSVGPEAPHRTTGCCRSAFSPKDKPQSLRVNR